MLPGSAAPECTRDAPTQMTAAWPMYRSVFMIGRPMPMTTLACTSREDTSRFCWAKRPIS